MILKLIDHFGVFNIRCLVVFDFLEYFNFCTGSMSIYFLRFYELISYLNNLITPTPAEKLFDVFS